MSEQLTSPLLKTREEEIDREVSYLMDKLEACARTNEKAARLASDCIIRLLVAMKAHEVEKCRLVLEHSRTPAFIESVKLLETVRDTINSNVRDGEALFIAAQSCSIFIQQYLDKVNTKAEPTLKVIDGGKTE